MTLQLPHTPALPRHMRTPPRYPHGWFPVARSREVQPHRPTTLQFAGRELVAFRDQTGAVRVLDAICPHFGAHMGDGTVENGRLRCPYHSLEFDEKGHCSGAAMFYEHKRVAHLRVNAYPCEERLGLLWMWNGPDPTTADRPVPVDALDWDAWTDPITTDGVRIENLTPLWLAENVADLAHLETVHCWEVDRIVTPPAAFPDGTFRMAADVRWRLGAQSSRPKVRALGRFVHSPFHIDARAVDAGTVVAHTRLTEEQGGLQMRSIVTVTPRADGATHLRVLMSVRKQFAGRRHRWLRRLTGRGVEDLLSQVFLQIGVSDFASDAMVWSRRVHLDRPVPIQGEGAMIEVRKWAMRFWPDDV
jgi:cholesterol 7-dehydrogenase